MHKKESKFSDIINYIKLYDVLYFVFLILTPFVLSLFNFWYFKNISASDMLSYTGTMISAYCALKLGIISHKNAILLQKRNDTSMYKIELFVNKTKKALMEYDEEKSEFSLGISFNINNGIENINSELESMTIEMVKYDYVKSEYIFSNDLIATNSEVQIFKRELNLVELLFIINKPELCFENWDLINSIIRKKEVQINFKINISNNGITSTNNIYVLLEKKEASDNKYFISRYSS